MTQPVTPNSIILGLPKMTWRNIVAPPYDMANSSGGWRQSEQAYPFIDVPGHQNVGRKSIPLTFKLYFLNTASGHTEKSTGQNDDLFPKLWEKWRDAFIYDGTPGKLVHPIHGTMDVVPMEWDIELSADRQSGIIMTVNFAETNLDPEADAEVEAIAVNLKDAARAADAAREEIGIDYPNGEREPGLFEFIGQIEGLIFSSRLTIGGYINQALGVVSGVIDLLELSQDTAKWAAVDIHIQLWNGLKDLGERVGVEVPREIGATVIGYDTSIDEVARDLGNTVGEIMSLNEELLGQPQVPAGSTVKYFA